MNPLNGKTVCTDEDIEKWANSKEKIIDEMPETLKLHITKKDRM